MPGPTTPTRRSSSSRRPAGAGSSRATSTRRMRAAKPESTDPRGEASTGHRRIQAERAALPAILAVALALRLWGIHQGLPYAFNADQNAHFVPRAIGMFGHSLDPQYFVNPPALTYVLH